MRRYYRVMLGKKSMFAEECFTGKFIGADFLRDHDLTGQLPEIWREFNKKFIDVVLKENPDKSRISAGLACGMLWTVSKGIQKNDIVLCPNGAGSYYVGEVMGDYSYHPGEILPHRRSVSWYPKQIERSSMSEVLKNSTGSIGTTCEVTSHAEEIENLIKGLKPATIYSTDETVEDPTVFALEKHLEDFLVQNWKSTELGGNYDIYEEDGLLVGQQYPSDTGPIDILAISKDKKEILVVELKKGRVSDNVVGQILRYMGFAMESLAEEGQVVKGVIIGLDDDLRIRRALAAVPNIDFYRYQVSFKLFK